FHIDKSFSISLEGNYHPRLAKEATQFIRLLDSQTGSFFKQQKVNGASKDAELIIRVQRTGSVTLDEEERYNLRVSDTGVLLEATTDIGAIRGLATLTQLVSGGEEGYYFPAVNIEDAPRFQWRGLMLDVARHFIPLNVIYRNIDAMAFVKLNVLHLHLSDDQGFRFESKVYPELTKKGSDGNYYTQKQLKELVAYANQKGIRVVPEIDVPGHATAILTAYPELGSKDTVYTLERFAGVFNPTLDPTNEEVYLFLKNLFAELTDVFPDNYYHIGGDENEGKHWDANPEIQEFMREHDLTTNHELQGYFNIRLQKILTDLGKRTMGWEEIMAPGLETTALIHSWKGKWEGKVPRKSLNEAAKSGYQTILSNGYYLDLMFSTESHYLTDPAPASEELTEEERSKILGGEMCMWSELVTAETIESRLWPRAAAIAERFWSAEGIKDLDDMFRRLEVVNRRLELLGLEHIANPNRIVRKLAAGQPEGTITTLLNVVGPMQGYTRNPGGTMYNTFSPYSLWADAAIADPKTARDFNRCIREYIGGSLGCDQLKEQLHAWSTNHDHLIKIIAQSPALREIEGLSANFSKVSRVGYEALEYLETNQTPKNQWFRSSRQALKQAEEQGGRTELQILSGLTRLVDHLEGSVK
ncbi:MAG: family 20 glycosylhydrolase, partial [Marinoscillum sp.]